MAINVHLLVITMSTGRLDANKEELLGHALRRFGRQLIVLIASDSLGFRVRGSGFRDRSTTKDQAPRDKE